MALLLCNTLECFLNDFLIWNGFMSTASTIEKADTPVGIRSVISDQKSSSPKIEICSKRSAGCSSS